MNPINLQKLADEFEISRKVRNLKKRTLSETRRYLNQFFDYLVKRNISHVDEITKEVIKEYQIALYEYINQQGRPNSFSHQNSVFRSVKQFFEFLKDAGYIVSNPARTISYANEPKTLPKSILTPSEARKILHAPDTKSVIGYRDRTMLEVFYTSGIRKTELRNITLSDVDYHDGFLRIQGKGDKDRVVPIGRIACRYLENYIKSVRPELIKDPYNNYLFLSVRGNQINQNMPWVLIKKYAKKARIKKNIHCHTFRHSCATGMLKNKADIRIIQELLGHRSLNTTQIYTRVSITDLKEVHKRCHPRERDKE